MRVPVLYLPASLPALEQVVLGIRTQLRSDYLIAVIGRGAPPTPLLRDGVVLLDVPASERGDLQLARALDLFDPGYRVRRSESFSALYDDVELEFASDPGKRHLVKVNGHELRGFAKSDLKFLRLLLLAAHRARERNAEDGGWISKTQLEDDEKDRGLADVRRALADHADLIKSKVPQDGSVRLAVLPHSIRIAPALTNFVSVNTGAASQQLGRTNRRRTPGQLTHSSNAQKGHQVVQALWRRIHKIREAHGSTSSARDGGAIASKAP